jgi:hypothetical protein
MRVLLAFVAVATLGAQAAPPALPWLDAADSIAEYIRTARIERIEDMPTGVTHPRRAFFAPGGPIDSVVIKDLTPGRRDGYWESYLSEIAAYEMDRLLQLNMVPPTVEKRVNRTRVSAQMFIPGCVWLTDLKGQQPPNVPAWNRQIARQRVFDNLIENIDRNAGNLLVYRAPGDRAWHLVLVDHSRAFTSSRKVLFEMSRIDRPLFERLRALDMPTLEARLGDLVAGDLRRILQRRDAIVAHFEKLASVKGEAAVFVP